MQISTGTVFSYALACALLLAAFLGLTAAAPAVAGTTALVSVSMTGSAVPAYSPSISADGRYIAFTSDSPDLVPGDTNGHLDAFVRDMVAGTTQRVSLSSTGQQLALNSIAHAISGDGRYVVVETDNADLVPGVTTGGQVYVYDRQTGAIELVSVSTAGEPGNDLTKWSVISTDGRYVAMTSLATNLAPGYLRVFSGTWQIYLRDRGAGTTELVSAGYDGYVGWNDSFLNTGGVSDDGRYVVFPSWSPNLVAGTGSCSGQIYLRDLLTSTTAVVSVSGTGAMANGWCEFCAMSPDGRYVVFTSAASNLVTGVGNGYQQTYLRDRVAGTTELVSVSNGGEPANGDPDGPGVAVSADGRWVVFQSKATNLVPDDTNGCGDVFARDRLTGVTRRVSVSSSGEQGDQGGGMEAISADGRYVTFESASTNLVPGATGEALYVHDLAGPFSDVWETSWAHQAVAASATAGIVSGYPDGTYQPENPVTRDQMAVYISRALAGGDANVPTGPATATFSDVPTDYWAFKYVEYAAAQNVVKGYSDGTYKPTEEVTRDQMAVFIARAIATPADGADLVNYTPPATATFPDVPTDFWAYKYVEYIAQPAIAVTQGYPDGDYHPEYICTRDQMAVYVARAFALPM